MVGAPGAQQVYVYSHLNGLWKEEQKILPPDGLTFNNVEFGIDVDYHNGSLVVGSDRWPDIGGERFGAVFLYATPYIDVGHTGAWYNPVTAGQGQLIDLDPESQFMFMAWFTFTDSGSGTPFEQHWFTAQGDYAGDRAELILYETLGGRFDDSEPVSTNPVGDVTLRVTGCGSGVMSYDIDTLDLQGIFPIERAIPGSENNCQERAGIDIESIDINAGMDGAWYDANTPGQGYLIDVHTDQRGTKFIFVAWFTYGDDTASGQRWLTAQGNFEGSVADIEVYETTGGSFDDPLSPSTVVAGTMRIDFSDCNNALLNYNLTNDGLEGSINIIRAIPGSQAQCEEIEGAD